MLVKPGRRPAEEVARWEAAEREAAARRAMLEEMRAEKARQREAQRRQRREARLADEALKLEERVLRLASTGNGIVAPAKFISLLDSWTDAAFSIWLMNNEDATEEEQRAARREAWAAQAAILVDRMRAEHALRCAEGIELASAMPSRRVLRRRYNEALRARGIGPLQSVGARPGFGTQLPSAVWEAYTRSIIQWRVEHPSASPDEYREYSRTALDEARQPFGAPRA